MLIHHGNEALRAALLRQLPSIRERGDLVTRISSLETHHLLPDSVLISSTIIDHQPITKHQRHHARSATPSKPLRPHPPPVHLLRHRRPRPLPIPHVQLLLDPAEPLHRRPSAQRILGSALDTRRRRHSRGARRLHDRGTVICTLAARAHDARDQRGGEMVYPRCGTGGGTFCFRAGCRAADSEDGGGGEGGEWCW